MNGRGNDFSLEDVAGALAAFDDDLCLRPKGVEECRPALPSLESLVQVIEDLRSVMFPGFFGVPASLDPAGVRFHAGATLDRTLPVVEEQIKRALSVACDEKNPCTCAECEERARPLAASFLGRLPEVRRMLAGDVAAAYEGDPAATSPAETILCYPGIFAITCHRIAHEMHNLGVPLVPRMISEHAHSLTGIDIHPGATIGERFFIDHGTGVVIGETSVIGNRVRLYQGVTLGARSFPLDEHGNPVKGVPRHPIVEDDVIVYSGATILGRITVGAGSVIGGNVWLTRSVPPGSRVAQGRETAIDRRSPVLPR